MNQTPPDFLSEAKRYFSSAIGWVFMAIGAVIPALIESLPALQEAYPNLKPAGLWLMVIGAAYKSILATKEGKQTQAQDARRNDDTKNA